LEERIEKYEKAIQSLETQMEQMKKELLEMRQAQKKSAAISPPPSTQVFGFLQTQYETTSGNNDSRYFVRRARVGVRGTLDKGFRYEIHGNLDDSQGMLRNAWIDYHFPREFLHTPILRFGQFKLPYSLEALKETGATTPLIERGIAVDQIGFNHDRDSGIALYTPANPHRSYEYFLSLTNGSGRNQFGANSSKLFAGRVQWNTTPKHPFFGGALAIGFATRQGSVRNLNRATAVQQENERYGLDLDYTAKAWHVRSEYLWGRDADRIMEGFYTLVGYRVSPIWDVLVRYEGFSPSRTAASVNKTTLGLTYRISQSAQALLNYEFVAGADPTGQGSGIRLRLQTLFP
jgi:hypothetical protein